MYHDNNTIHNTQVSFSDREVRLISGTYVIPTMALDDSTPLFSFLGVFLSYITPHDMTIVNCVLEFLKDALHSRVSLFNLILEALKLESGFICLMTLFLLISIIPLCVTIVWGCSPNNEEIIVYSDQVNNVNEAGGQNEAIPTIEEPHSNSLHYRRFLQFLLQFFTIILIAAITVMFITNELITSSINKTPDIVKTSLKDAELFIKEAHSQITNTVQDGLSSAIERIKDDLENVDKLLGESIQKDLETYSGIKTTVESIFSVCSANYEITHRVQLLQDAVGKAIIISKEATQRIEEFQIQLKILQRQCTARDRPLCETLRLRGFEENGLLNSLTKLQGDPVLVRMLNLGEYYSNNVQVNISIELQATQAKFQNFPLSVKHDLLKNKEDIIRLATEMRDRAYSATEKLTMVKQNILDRVDDAWEYISPLFNGFKETSRLLWFFGISTSIGTLITSLILTGGLLLGMIHEERAAKNAFIIGASIIGMASIALAIFTIAIMLLAGHGEVFLCRPLYDTPNYQVLGKLFDKPGLVYENETTDGIIDDLLQLSDASSTITINATLASAINRCEHNEAAYPVFQIDHLMNVTQLLDLHENDDLETEIEKISVSAAQFTSLTEPLTNILNYMFINSDINFTSYRLELTESTPEKDLSIFIDQMQRVSAQIHDSSTTSRMSALGNRARRLQTTILQPLERLRSDIHYELTALQIQREPWADMVNQSLTNLRTTQFFINEDSSDICYNKSLIFKNRLKDHLDTNQKSVINLLNGELAACRPLFDIFNTNRMLICQYVIDKLNGLWFSSFLCLCLWDILTPIALGLSTAYSKMSHARNIRRSSSHQAPADTLIISEQSNWGSRLLQRQSVRSSRSEITNFTFDDPDEQTQDQQSQQQNHPQNPQQPGIINRPRMPSSSPPLPHQQYYREQHQQNQPHRIRRDVTFND